MEGLTPLTSRRQFTLDDLHFEARLAFKGLCEDLARSYKTGRTQRLLCPFEGYRGPDRQRYLLAIKASKAGPWQSPHQLGLAVDFWPNDDDRVWHFDPSAAEIEELHKLAKARGLDAPISWDPMHIEHPAWNAIRKAIR